jgi:hypothetical protein
MFEEILAYQPGTHLNRPFSELLAAELDEDARLFSARMASDIALVAAGVDRPSHRATIVRTLLMALVAPPPARTAFWRRLYREISVLVAGCAPEAAPAGLRAEVARALARLRQFLRENPDVADALAIEELERTVLGRAVGA